MAKNNTSFSILQEKKKHLVTHITYFIESITYYMAKELDMRPAN